LRVYRLTGSADEIGMNTGSYDVVGGGGPRAGPGALKFEGRARFVACCRGGEPSVAQEKLRAERVLNPRASTTL
jgi:hypothetical protein